jgi:hypothetical protein
VNAVVTLILLAAVLLGTLGAVFYPGARAGGAFWYRQLQRTRLESARAKSHMHDLTRDAFVAMAEHVERHRDRP